MNYFKFSLKRKLLFVSLLSLTSFMGSHQGFAMESAEDEESTHQKQIKTNLDVINFAGEFYKARQDYGKALQCFMCAANHGHLDAIYNQGALLPKGQDSNFPKLEELTKNIKLLEIAARRGHFGAPVSLGNIYRLNKEDKEAFKWFEISAKQKNPMGQLWLAEMYKKGKGVQQDLAQALKYNVLAANQEDVEVQEQLAPFFGDLYSFPNKFGEINEFYEIALNANGKIQAGIARIFFGGRGVEKDFLIAFSWIERALKQKSQNAFRYYPKIKKKFLTALDALGPEGMDRELRAHYSELFEEAELEYLRQKDPRLQNIKL